MSILLISVLCGFDSFDTFRAQEPCLLTSLRTSLPHEKPPDSREEEIPTFPSRTDSRGNRLNFTVPVRKDEKRERAVSDGFDRKGESPDKTRREETRMSRKH